MMKQVYGESVKGTTVHLWFNRFKKGSDTRKDKEKSGRPKTPFTPPSSSKNSWEKMVRWLYHSSLTPPISPMRFLVVCSNEKRLKPRLHRYATFHQPTSSQSVFKPNG
ncbi:hypothetical protein PGB90_008986 [Kerria lacca]